MALTIYPALSSDSFIAVADADTVITENSILSTDWLALTEVQKEVYLRIATSNIHSVVSTDSSNIDGYLDSETYVYADSCLYKTCALMAVHDLTYGLSAEVNPNTGLVSKEKVGDLEVTYFHGNPLRQVSGRSNNPFPSSVIKCLNSYGADVTSGSGIKQARLERK